MLRHSALHVQTFSPKEETTADYPQRPYRFKKILHFIFSYTKLLTRDEVDLMLRIDVFLWRVRTRSLSVLLGGRAVSISMSGSVYRYARRLANADCKHVCQE